MRTLHFLLTVAALGGLFPGADTFAQTWTQTSAPITNWSAAACSADRSRLVAAIESGGIYTSTNSGATWAPTTAPSAHWVSVASSADGTRLAAASYYGIFVSLDSGLSWESNSPAPFYGDRFGSIASSADGTKLIAGSTTSYYPLGDIYVLSNGVWRQAHRGGNWNSVGSSADGTRLAALSFLPLYDSLGLDTSADSGDSWQLRSPPHGSFVASSADGSQLVVPGYSGVFTSTNFGASWTSNSALPYASPFVAAVSADRSMLVAAIKWGGPIYSSTDFAGSWTSNSAPVTNWAGVATSADGHKLVAVVNGGGIYTSQSEPNPSLTIKASGADLLLSWIVPSMDFTLQQNPHLTTTNWTDVPATPTLNLANLQNQVLVSATGVARFFRLKH